MSGTVPGQPDDAEAASTAGVADLTARIAAIRAMLQADPAEIGPLLQMAGAGMAPKLLLSPHAPTTLSQDRPQLRAHPATARRRRRGIR